LSRNWKNEAQFLLIYDSTTANERTEFEYLTRGVAKKKDPDLRVQLGIHSVPFAVITDRDGVVVSKGMVNGASHLESLLEYEKARRVPASIENANISEAGRMAS
jgi:hypothetical protein